MRAHAQFERHFGSAGDMRCDLLDRLAAGCLRKQPTGVEENRRLKVLEKALGEGSESTINRNLLSSFAVTSRHFRDVRINQRIDSLPCPALFSMFPGRQVRDNQRRGRGFHQTTTIGLRRLELRLDYVGVGGEWREGKVGSG
jgi:hypothetical protein